MISEPLLNAVLHLFALQASCLPGPQRDLARRQVQAYLHQHVGLANAATYLGLYDDLVEAHEPDDASTLLEKTAQTAGRLKTLLQGAERHAVVLRFMELAVRTPRDSRQRKMARLLGAELGMAAESLDAIFSFMAHPSAQVQLDRETRLLGGQAHSFRGRVAALRLPAENLILISPVGGESMRLEGQPVGHGECHLMRPGHALRDAWGNELHYASVAAAFEEKAMEGPAITFRGRHLAFRFPGSENGLHDFSFSEQSGRMIAILGGSGAGKSTLLNILNGSLAPDSGELLLNGRNVHTEPEAVEGVIGFVPQDDLLFEDLTVFENLYYAACLCMAHLPHEERVRRVQALLADLGQSETAHFQVGSPLKKTISGGQRKRLNIALELIREPPVLFVDEPTSGLSSADSDLVMSLLKNQAARGKLIFVVIHQPSSKIFRSFDGLWVLDQGGWPVFTGTPLESLGYFRSRGDLPGADEAICPGCGGVNPEQLLEIIEDKLLDPVGLPTRERRIAPEKWNQLFRDYDAQRQRSGPAADADHAPEKSLHRPGLLGQLRVFFARDVRARLSSRTYRAITLLEPPLLGLLLGLVSRGAFGGDYVFHDNNNLHVFFFMSVMVSLFLGLTVSAQEICRDGKILRREQFLHLSWWSYINSKSVYLALVSALQMLLYLAVAQPLIEVPGLFLKTWAVLFSGAFCSCLLGLNLSASFRSAVTIYILIPLLLIPQMLLSGVVISYDDLLAPHARRREVPAYANLLPSRWAYEALVVEQFCHNAYTRHVLEADARLRRAEYELDYYLPELLGLAQSIPVLREQGASVERIAQNLEILRQEWARLDARFGLSAGGRTTDFTPAKYQDDMAREVVRGLGEARNVVFGQRREAAAEKKAIEARLEQTLGREELAALKKRHTNRSIEEQVLKWRELEPVGVARDGLFARTLPIYQTPESRLGGSHFLARHKRVGDHLVPTYSFNLLAIHALTFILYLILCFRPVAARFSAVLGSRLRAQLARG